LSETIWALGVWLPLGTLLPFVVARLTGNDWRGALIEASIFACFGLLVYPIFFALILVRLTAHPLVQLYFLLGWICAVLTSLGYRRKIMRAGRW